MTVGSILPGRLPLSLVAQRHMSLIEQNSQALARLQQQVASGRQYVRPSEAPSSAIQAMLLQKTLERKAQMTENIQTSRSFLAATESALGSVGDALNSAKSLALAGIGDTLTSTEKEGLAVEAASLLQSVINTANTKFRGRYLFGGSRAETAPFELAGNGIVRYAGDTIAIESFADLDLLVASNVDGATAFGAMTEPIGADLNPALTLETRIADLYGGTGVDLGVIQITLESGGSQQTASVDLSGAETIGDIKTRLEAAFASGPLTLAVDIDPATRSGLRLTPSAGTITVSDLPGSTVADDLAIASGPSAQIVGGDLDPRLTLQTELADLRAGSGIDQTGGLQIVNGDRTVTVDVSSAQTIEDLLNAMRTADPDLSVGINAAGNGLSVSSRLSGTGFSVGENGGTTATDLGLRTMTAATSLSELNRGQGVPFDASSNLKITRRDGTTVSIDLSNALTIQDVLDAINAVDPGNLVASLNAVGNGISLLDNSGTGPLIVESNAVAVALGLAGEEDSGDPANPLVGEDVNPREATGVLTILAELEQALRRGDDQELQRLTTLIDDEINRFNQVRAELGSRLKLLDDIENQVRDQDLVLQEKLSEKLDTDLPQTLTELLQQQQTLEATLALTAQSFRLSVLSFLT